MRVLIVCDNYYPSRAACAVRLRVFAETLMASGHFVRVIASDTSLIEGKAEGEALEYVTYFPVHEMKEKTLLARLRNNLDQVFSARKAAVDQGDFDVVISSSPPVLLVSAARRIAKDKGAKFVLDIRDIWPDVAFEMSSFKRGSIYDRLFSSILEKAYQDSVFVTTVSERKVLSLRERLGDSSEKVQLVQNGLDLTFLQQEEDQSVVEKYDLSSEKPTCAYIGNIGLAQGLGTLLDAAVDNPRARFLVFGNGAEKTRLVERAQIEGLTNVEFYEPISGRAVFTVLNHVTFSYVPLVSSKLLDSVPTKMFEAFGCECPVLLATAGESVKILKDIGLGLSVAPENKEELLKTFKTMFSEGFSASQRRLAKEKTISHYSRQAAAKHLVSLLEQECK